MTRKMLIVAVSLIALTFGALSMAADAQSCSYADRIAGRCGTAIAGPSGPLTVTGSGSAAGTGASATSGVTTTPGASNPTADTTLAFTGAESAVLGYVGAGLIGVGTVALVARRRLTD